MRCARTGVRALRGHSTWQRASPSVWCYGLDADALAESAQSAPNVFGRHAVYVPPKALDYELPAHNAPEVALAGRSNVGKSTLVGALLGDPKLVRTSKKPGRTTTARLFAVAQRPEADAARAARRAACFLVDLPGVGFARKSKRDQDAFGEASAAYLNERPRHILRHALVLCDARRGPCADLLDAFDSLRVAHRVVFTKGDLASPSDLVAALDATAARFSRKLSSLVPVVHVVSAKTGAGVDDLRAHLASIVVD